VGKERAPKGRKKSFVTASDRQHPFTTVYPLETPEAGEKRRSRFFLAEYNEPVQNSEVLQKVRAHLELYDHPLLAFSAREHQGSIEIEHQGSIEILIDLKHSTVPVHTYVLPIHARDLDHPQFTWNLQRQLYDGLHDYFIEMFTRTPQDHNVPRTPVEKGI
jgi:hypothetical protein